MGTLYQGRCGDCGHRFTWQSGGGFLFHLLRCETCGTDRSVLFEELGELHGRWLKGLPGVYSVATAQLEEAWRQATPGDPIGDDEYRAGVEDHAGGCGCGGHFRFDAPARCPQCRSTALTADFRVGHYD
jgi:hypothetical protein